MRVNRGWAMSVAGAAIVAAGLAGCSDNTSDTATGTTETMTSTGTPATVTSGAVSGTAGPGAAKVTVDGKPQQINGQVVCSTNGGNMNIAIGEATSGIGIMLTEDASRVSSVGLGNVDGVALGFQEGAPGGSATATRDGKIYKVSGTATGIDMANPTAPTTKPFEIEVTCP